ncbi:MAG: PQQ-binding-like beta-propeller repeat protein [Planctomycetales bacterium]|nr:PQQ-binding-like beta-propeller repeat protein [Planctomycetales bacterium]
MIKRAIVAGFVIAALSTLHVRWCSAAEPMVMVVMDPLSKPLSCDCVRGYAQRDYAVLAAKLEQATGRDVRVVWHQSLAEALKETDGKADLVIGKYSVVVADAKSTKRRLSPVAQLTGKDGTTNQHGLIVVRSADSAIDLKSLDGYKILFGPIEAEEKSTAAERAFQHAGIQYDDTAERFGACSEAATAMLKMPQDQKVAAVISSYAEPLLKGCGSIREGELRVVGKTENVPFVTAFLRNDLPQDVSESIQIALLTAGTDREFLKSMETLAGFVPWTGKPTKNVEKESDNKTEIAPEKDNSRTGASWPQFRGPKRDGRIDWLPERLPDLKDDLVWSRSMPSVGLGGIAIDDGVVIISGRDASDTSDTFTAFSLSDGRPMWQDAYPSAGSFDYGNTPRATPAIVGSVVYTLGTAGVMSALDLHSGMPRWRVDLAKRFNEPPMTWGFCSSPLVVDETVYVQLGSKTPLVALNASDGETRWAGPGRPAGYSSLVSTQKRGFTLLVGTDRLGYFIRFARDGRYVWFRNRPISGDFAVPAPLIDEKTLFFTGENNGVEAYDLDKAMFGDGFNLAPSATNDRVLPDSHTPVLVGDQLLVAYAGLQCLDAANGMAEKWTVATDQITAYASIIASEQRALVTTEDSQLILVDLAEGNILETASLADDAPPLLSHPAIANDHLVLRVGNDVRCYRLQ